MHCMRSFPGRGFPVIWLPGLGVLTPGLSVDIMLEVLVCVCVRACAHAEQEVIYDKCKQQITVGPPHVLRHVWVEFTYQLDICYIM
jgi:hypothetical protein